MNTTTDLAISALSISLTALVDRLNIVKVRYDVINSRVVLVVADIATVEAVLQKSANCAQEINYNGVLIIEEDSAI